LEDFEGGVEVASWEDGCEVETCKPDNLAAISSRCFWIALNFSCIIEEGVGSAEGPDECTAADQEVDGCREAASRISGPKRDKEEDDDEGASIGWETAPAWAGAGRGPSEPRLSVCACLGGLFSCAGARKSVNEAPRTDSAEGAALVTSPPSRIDRFCRMRLSAESGSSSSLPRGSERALAEDTSRRDAGAGAGASRPRLAARSIERVVASSDADDAGVDRVTDADVVGILVLTFAAEVDAVVFSAGFHGAKTIFGATEGDAAPPEGAKIDPLDRFFFNVDAGSMGLG
jgi:hypothetical protein